jgi:hypothetical protein
MAITLTRDQIVDAVFAAVDQAAPSELSADRSRAVLDNVLDLLRATEETEDEGIASAAWWERVATRVSALAQLAWSATFDAMNSDEYDATGDADDAAREKVAEIVRDLTGFFDSETLTWTFDAQEAA